ncbi:MAG: DUF3089 domain-containing protein [Actinomycetota bacterium]
MRTHRGFLLVVVVALVLAAAGCAGDDDGETEAAATTDSGGAEDAVTTTVAKAAPAYPGYASEVYANTASWLCRGDVDDDPCDTDLDATVVRADGTVEVETFEPSADAAVDCFYVYPTISTDETPNSDMLAGEDQEIFVVRQQAARLGSVCRVFAPIYRQTTLTALVARLSGGEIAPNTGETAYADVVDAWKHYMANDNGGRGVVLIGHSQGSGLLTRLLADEIDPDADMRSRLVSAYLLGSGVAVPTDADVGGAFTNVALCRAREQVGCAVSYASFRASAPPPANSFFGRVDEGRAACVNPAALEGGRGTLRPYFPADGRAILSGQGPSGSDWTQGATVDTPFVTLPDFVDAECVEADGFSYLSLSVRGDPADPRIDDIGGDLTPEWGMHLIDANVAMGSIVDLVAEQAEAYTGA